MDEQQPSSLPTEVQPKKELTEEKSLSKNAGIWLHNHYLDLINFALAIYVLLPMLAPVFMKTGNNRAADFIYRAYRPLCHQLAYRSFFLFGEQTVYPRAIAGIEGLKSYEQVTGNSPDDNLAAINFRGNEQLGYKTAMCQRDLAIYGSLLLFGIIFALTRRKLKPLPWYLWILLALVPIGLDGFSQLISQWQLPFLQGLAVRESAPWMRVISGTLFGWFTGWFGLPSLEEMINEPIKTPLIDQNGES